MVESTGGSSSTRDSGAPRPGQNYGQGVGQHAGQHSGQGSGQAGQSDRFGSGSETQREKDRGVVGQVKQKAGEWTDAVTDKAKDLLEDGKTFAQNAKETAKEWAHTASEKVGEARTAMGEGMERFGGGVRDKGGSASAMVGGGLEAAGTYLREHDFAGMNESMKDVVRRHPVQSVLVGIGLGFVLSRAMRR